MKPWLVTVLPVFVFQPPSRPVQVVLVVLCVVAIVWAVRDGRQS